MNELISLIIPCYNCESSLPRCLDSVFSNTYKIIEVICVNDGSTDNTLSILKRYSSFYNNLKIINQSNHRQGYCRNRGIEVARGDYICFLDSDDTLEKNFFDNMLSKIVGYDVAICGFNYVINDNIIHSAPMPNKELSLKEFWDNNFVNSIWSVVPWNKIYSRDTLKKIRFREDVFFEDEFFATDVFSKNVRINSVSDNLYNYYFNSKSTMHTNDVFKKIFRAESRNIRSLFFVNQGWEELYNKTSRETLYLLLRIREIAKNKKLLPIYGEKIGSELNNLRKIIDLSIDKKIVNFWDLYFFSKNRFIFKIVYFFRRILRVFLRRNSKDDF